jgi:hypothetical protein
MFLNLHLYYCMWRYTHGIRSDLIKQKIKGFEVKAFGDYLINVFLTPIIVRRFGSYLRELEDNLADGPTSLYVGRTGNQDLITLCITANYFAQPHLDNKDMGFAFLSWSVEGKLLLIFSILILCILICVHVLFMFLIWFFVEREWVGHIKMGGEFL